MQMCEMENSFMVLLWGFVCVFFFPYFVVGGGGLGVVGPVFLHGMIFYFIL